MQVETLLLIKSWNMEHLSPFQLFDYYPWHPVKSPIYIYIDLFRKKTSTFSLSNVQSKHDKVSRVSGSSPMQNAGSGGGRGKIRVTFCPSNRFLLGYLMTQSEERKVKDPSPLSRSVVFQYGSWFYWEPATTWSARLFGVALTVLYTGQSKNGTAHKSTLPPYYNQFWKVVGIRWYQISTVS